MKSKWRLDAAIVRRHDEEHGLCCWIQLGEVEHYHIILEYLETIYNLVLIEYYYIHYVETLHKQMIWRQDMEGDA